MTENKVFLADTYALIEFIAGNKNYRPYLNQTLLTTKFNLIELYYYLLRNYNETQKNCLCNPRTKVRGKQSNFWRVKNPFWFFHKTADEYLMLYSRFVIEISYSCIKYAMKFKLENKKEKLSYVDCIGYALSKELGINFLTGDQKFEGIEGVEFVK